MHEQQPAVLDFCAEMTQKNQSRPYCTACNKCSRTTLKLVPEINAPVLKNVLYLSSFSVLKINLENCAVHTVKTVQSVHLDFRALNDVRTVR